MFAFKFEDDSKNKVRAISKSYSKILDFMNIKNV